MSIYDIDYKIQSDNLDAPQRRLPKFQAFLFSLMSPLQWLRDLFFIEYVNGAYGLYSNYSGATVYVIGDRVIFSNRGIYECIAPTTGNSPLDTTYWIKILDNFIGLSERMKYTSQIITFEYLLNRWFFNIGAATQIYIQNNTLTTPIFLMGQTGPYSSTMSQNGTFATTFMAVTPTFPVQYNFTIYVPAALFATLGTNTNNREQAIRNYADKFVLAGITYTVTTF